MRKMRNQLILLMLLCISAAPSFAQTCASTSPYPYLWPSHKNWFFAPNLWTGTIKDMSTGAETVAGYVGLAVTSYEGTSCVSDDSGNLVFYANGRRMWRNTGAATTLISSALTTGNEGGANSSGSAVQGLITVRHPLNPNVYHIFMVDDVIGGFREGLSHRTYNSSTNTLSSKTRVGNYRTGEGVAATKHKNGVDIWVTTYQANSINFHSYLVKCDGSIDPAVTSAVAPNHNNNELRGGLAFSFQGDKMAQAYPNATGGQADHEVEVFNFDNATGILTTLATCSDIATNESACDVTFSPDGNRVYYSTATGAVYTYDISSGVNATIKGTRTIVGAAGGAYPSIEIAADGNLYRSAGTTGVIKKLTGNLNAGTGFVQTNGSTASGSLGLPSMYLPPQEEPNITEVGPYTTCDVAVDLATVWVCAGTNAEDAANYPAAYQGTGITNNGTGIFNPATAGVGTHEIIFTRCAVDDTINIVVSSCCPDTTLAGSFGPVCTSGSTIDLTTVENGKVGTWTITVQPGGGDATITGGDQFNSNSAVAGNYTVRFDVTGAAGGCVMPTRTFTINALPAVTVNDATICAGDAAATFTATAATATGYVWSANGSGILPATTGTTAGSYTVVVTDANTCTNTATGTLTVNTIPAVTVNDATICAGDAAATFTATAATATGYLWSVNGSGILPTTTGTTAGSYTVVVTDANTCTNTTTGTLTVNTIPAVTVNDATICAGDAAATFTATAATATGYVWSVNGSGILPATTGTTAGSYTVVVTDANTCTNTATGTLIVNVLPVVSVNSSAICVGDAAVTFTATSDSTAASHLWSANGTGISSTTTGTTVGNYTVAVTDNNGCVGSGTGVLTTNVLPVITVNSATICTGDAAATFTATSDSTSASHLWSANGTGASSTTTGTAAGNYTVAVTDNNGCIGSGTGVLTTNVLPVITVNSATICTGDAAATFTATSDSTSASHLWSANGTGASSTTTGTAAGNYTVAVTDNNGCIGSGTGVLTVNVLPVVSVNSSVICVGDAAVTFTATSDSASASHLWSANGTGTNSTTSGTTAGNYTVAVTDNNGCVGSGTGVLTENALPVIAVNSAAICVGDAAATFTATSDSIASAHLWSVNGSGTAGTTTGTAAGNYTVQVTDNNGCISSGTGVLTVNALPSVTLNDGSICPGSILQYDAGAGFTYLWQDGSVNQTYTSTVAETVFVRITDGNGCIARDTSIVSLNSALLVNLGPDLSACTGETVSLNIVSSGFNSVTHTIAWSTGASSDSVTISNTSQVVVVVNDAQGCSGTDTVEITINTKPNLSIADQTICADAAVVTFDAGQGYSNYLWSGASNVTSQTTAGNASGIYTVEVIDANGCKDTTSATLTANALPTVDLGVDKSMCAGSTSTFDAVAGFTYLWQDGSTGQTYGATVAEQVDVLITDGNGCTARDTALVTIQSGLTVSLGPDQNVCQPSTVTLSASGYTAATHTMAWSTGASTDSIIVSTTGTIYLDVTDAQGCAGSDTIVITASVKPNITIADQTICSGDAPVTFDGGAGFTSYLWTGNGSGTGQTALSNTAGTYTVEVVDASGCKDTTNATLTINALPVVDLGVDKSMCAGSTSTFDAVAGFTYLWQDGSTGQTYGATVAEQVDVLITDGNGCTARDTALVTIQSGLTVSLGPDQNVCQPSTVTLSASGYTAATHTMAWSTGASTDSIIVSTTGTIYLDVTDAQGCAGSDTIVITASVKPNITIADQTICSGDAPVTFDAGAGFSNYVWSGNSTSTSQTTLGSIAGIHSVIVTDTNGCKDTTNTELTINALPTVIFNDRSICPGSNSVFDAGAGYTYLWQDGSNNQTYTAAAAESVFVTITDGNNCTARDTASVSLQSGLQVSIGTDQNLCTGETAVFTVTNSGYTSSSHTISWNTGAATDSISVTTTSQVIVVVTDPQGCLGTDTAEVIMNNIVRPYIPVQTICVGDAPVVFDGGPGFASYLWEHSITPTSGRVVMGQNQKLTTNIFGYYVLSVSDYNACTDTSTTNLITNQKPVVDLGIDQSMCSGSTVIFDAGNPGSTYAWQDASGNQTFTGNQAGSVFVAVTDVNGCIGKDTALVSIQAGLTVSLGPDQSVCDGTAVTLDAGFSTSTNTILWSTGDNTQTITVSSTAEITVEVTDIGGCKGYDTIAVAVNANPTASLVDQAICVGAPPVSFDPGTGSGWDYLWSGDVVSGVDLTDQTYTSNTPGTFTCTVTDANSCTGSWSATLSVNDLPTVDIGDTIKVCPGINATFTAVGTGTIYQWNGKSTETSSTYVTKDVGYVWIQASNASGCVANDTTYLANLSALAVDFGDDIPICEGESTTLISDRTGSSYTYDWNDGVSTTESIVVSPTVSATYELFVLDGGGCAGYDTVRVIVNPNPIVDIPAQTICAGDAAVTFDAGNTGSSFVWSGDYNETGQTYSTNVAENFVVTVTDVNSCVGSGASSLTVHDLPTPVLTDNRMCFGTTPVSFSPGPSYVSYAWSGLASGQTSSTVTDSTAGKYVVQVTDINGCSASDSATLTVNSNPVVYLGGDLTICEGNSVNVGDPSFDGSSETLLWNISSSGQYVTVDTSGVYQLTVNDTNGCVGTDSMLLTVNPIPTYTKPNDTVVCFETSGSLIMSVEISTRDEVFWEIGGNSTGIEITEEGIYPFTVTTPTTLCKVSDTIIVAERCTSTVFVPNAFSPDGDGTNDIFYAEGVNIQDFEIYIYNRWGEEIFFSDNLYKGWDGKYMDNKVQIDVYVWKMYYSTEEDHGGRKQRSQTGTVTVIR